MNQRASNGSAVITFVEATNLTIVGNSNSYWVSATDAGGIVSIDGQSNTIVLRASATPATFTVIGTGNTVYLPEGSPVTVTGSGAAATSVKYYKP